MTEERKFDEFDNLGLSKLQRVIAMRLFEKPDTIVPISALFAATYGDRKAPPLEINIAIKISQIRTKLQGSRFSIKNVWGRGYVGRVA